MNITRILLLKVDFRKMQYFSGKGGLDWTTRLDAKGPKRCQITINRKTGSRPIKLKLLLSEIIWTHLKLMKFDSWDVRDAERGQITIFLKWASRYIKMELLSLGIV